MKPKNIAPKNQNLDGNFGSFDTIDNQAFTT